MLSRRLMEPVPGKQLQVDGSSSTRSHALWSPRQRFNFSSWQRGARWARPRTFLLWPELGQDLPNLSCQDSALCPLTSYDRWDRLFQDWHVTCQNLKTINPEKAPRFHSSRWQRAASWAGPATFSQIYCSGGKILPPPAAP